MARQTGGQAFPVPGDEEQIRRDGMTLRDYFAGQALTGIVASYSGPGIPLPVAKGAAMGAYAYADAMLSEREKPEE